MNNAQILAAAALIRDIDPALADVFLCQPFNRHTLVSAFHHGLSMSTTYADLADQIAATLRSAIDSTKCERVA